MTATKDLNVYKAKNDSTKDMNVHIAENDSH